MFSKIFLGVFWVFVYYNSFSQTTDQSSHPLLDKYYPRSNAADTTTPTKTVTSLSPSTTNQAPVTTAPVTTAAPTLTSTAKDEPSQDTKAANSINTTTVTTTPSATTVVSKPAIITTTTPAQVSKPYDPNSLYYDTRLGSSSPQYDTYEKNNNGAGSVTTSPK